MQDSPFFGSRAKFDLLVLTPTNQNYVYKKRDNVVSVPAMKA